MVGSNLHALHSGCTEEEMQDIKLVRSIIYIICNS